MGPLDDTQNLYIYYFVNPLFNQYIRFLVHHILLPTLPRVQAVSLHLSALPLDIRLGFLLQYCLFRLLHSRVRRLYSLLRASHDGFFFGHFRDPLDLSDSIFTVHAPGERVRPDTAQSEVDLLCNPFDFHDHHSDSCFPRRPVWAFFNRLVLDQNAWVKLQGVLHSDLLGACYCRPDIQLYLDFSHR